MKLAEHTEHIRVLIDTAFRNRLGRMGITNGALISANAIPQEYIEERRRMEAIREVFIAETGTIGDAYEKLVEELNFTLFNRLAALKVMEAHTLHPEIVTRREAHGGRSIAHLAWLEQNPQSRSQEAEDLVAFIEDQLCKLSSDIPLFSPQYPYHLLPTPFELQGIVNAFNAIGAGPQAESDIWKSDDVLGWLYESYNTLKKKAHKDSGEKIEYQYVSLRSQTYTPKWVVKFLVDNSLGKFYLEMYPDSEIKEKYKIAHAPQKQSRERKPLNEIKLIDPSNGSGNFLLYAFDLFYDLYLDQIENYGAKYNQADVPKLIVERNLHGIDLDDRAVQLAQLGLFIKAKRKKRNIKIEYFNVVSSDFFLPTYAEVKNLFENEAPLDEQLETIVIDLWKDLQQAHKFGSLIRLEEKFNISLHRLVQSEGVTLFTEENVKKYNQFRESFFANLQKAVALNAARQGKTFLNTKTQDAITFLQLLTQSYDVAVANPPYTDSADFGTELKHFIDSNYKQPFKFNSNLYAAFIKRCYELTNDDGLVGMIHPLTFMYIKTFEDVRKFMLSKTHINIFVDYGLSNLFGNVMVDPAFYILEKRMSNAKTSLFISLDQYTRTPNERFKKQFCLDALNDYVENRQNKHNVTLPQEKLKIIEGSPFIYWISDAFREKFQTGSLKDFYHIKNGVQTGNNDKYLRFWWELNRSNISTAIDDDKPWKFYSKGGKYNKWYGNLWTTINWNQLKGNYPNPTGKGFFKPGVVFSGSSSKGTPFRILHSNNLFDNDAPLIFKKENNADLHYTLGLMNSQLSFYTLSCLNPTVKTQVGDVKRVPFFCPSSEIEKAITEAVKDCVNIKKGICTYNLIEWDFLKTPLTSFFELTLKDKTLSYFNFENLQLTKILLYEAVINDLVFKVYDLNKSDREQVETKMGKSVGNFPVLQAGKDAFLQELQKPLDIELEHIQSLALTDFDEQKVRTIKESFTSLYQSNNDLEEFCIRNQVNPINVWYWFKEANVVPQARAGEIALEFLADTIRTLLQQDEDGIIPLVGLPGEDALSQRLEQYCLDSGFTAAQFMQLENLMGHSINEYLEHHFFKKLSDHLNLFMYLPKTPFIWHLSSGEHQGFEVYILIYKWNRDSLFKLKRYINIRVEKLEYRQITMQGLNTAGAQSERERIRLQVVEIEGFTKKIDELIAEGYDPKLDDGVGKNIAPLQNKGLLRADVLNAKQLQKYLNADW